MIVDSIEQKRRYYGLGPRFATAFDFLSQPDLDRLPEGRMDLGNGVCAIVQRRPGRPVEQAKFEYHRLHADLQYCVQGPERCGWSLERIDASAHPFDEEKDAGLLDGPINHFVNLHSGHFAVFFPGELHAPLIGEGLITKIVLKVPIS